MGLSVHDRHHAYITLKWKHSFKMDRHYLKKEEEKNLPAVFQKHSNEVTYIALKLV